MNEKVGNRVLLVGPEASLPFLPSLIERDSGNSVKAEVAEAINDALDRLAEKGWDAVICWADREDELAAVVRIRKATPKTPILLLTSRREPEFADLARRMGSTRVVPKPPDLKTVSKTIRLAVTPDELAEELLVQTERAHTVTRDLRTLVAQNKALARQARSNARTPIRTAFVPLVVEDDLDDALLLVRAFARANIHSPLPILKNGDEAINYLSEAARPDSTLRFPLPSVVLLDVFLPGKSGFDVLSWVRRQPGFRRLPVIMLSSSADPTNINRSYELGANSYLVKPTTFPALVELVSGLRLFWDNSQRWDTGLDGAPGPPP